MEHRELRVLFTEATAGACDDAARRLADAGHVVHRCHTDAEGAQGHVPCIAWQSGAECPLLAGTVDVVVDVRVAHGPETPREQGAMCAMLAGVPLVVCGPTDTTNGPLLRADAVCLPERLLAACHAAASPVGPTAERAVREAIGTALAGLGEPPRISVRLELRDRTVVADVTVAAAPCATTYRRVRTAVRTALARFTPAWPYTPVTLYHVEPCQQP
ncbi:MAG: hypothetical protein HOV94_17275 [Saccharothrix sp.]|nr:hypothetical protein [Saccharothrix sp.]